MLKCEVQLGNIDRWPASRVDTSITFAGLTARGMDAVFIPRNGGDEYVVYSKQQVRLLEVRRVKQRGGSSTMEFDGPWHPVTRFQGQSRSIDLDSFLRGTYQHRAPSHGSSSVRPPCKYGASCYRTSLAHRQKYTHDSNSVPPSHQPDGGTWTCEVCTFTGTPLGATNCGVCQSPQPNSSRGVWTCTVCTFAETPIATLECGVCGTPRRGRSTGGTASKDLGLDMVLNFGVPLHP
jgi:hypothetical protein